jgi:L-cysteine/cystine lyase
VTAPEARSRYPVLEHLAYLNAGTSGPLSRATHAAMAEWAERALLSGRAGRAYFDAAGEVRQRVRQRLGALLGVPPGSIAITCSTTDGCNLVVTGLRLTPEDEVVTTDAEHPGLEQPVRASGARVRVVSVLGRSAPEVVEAIAEAVTPRTRLVALSHVLWLNGQVLPIAEIRRATGVPLLVDGAQSVGAIPVDAAAADFYTVSGQKWLCGPQLTGALYVADPDRLRPQVAGYNTATGEGVGRLEVVYHDPGMLAGLLAALDERPEWAFERAAEMARRCREALAAAGLQVHSPGEGTLVSVTPPGDPDETVAACRERGIVVRSLPNGWLRVSCGWWTTDEEVSRLVDALV